MTHGAKNESPRDRTQYPQNAPDGSSVGNSADIADTLGHVEKLLRDLDSMGVVLSIEDNGLAFDGPEDVLTDDLLGRMRAERDGLLALVRGRDVLVSVVESEPVATSIVCPWCRSDRLADDADGIRCDRCERLAWVVVGSSVIRADVVDDDVEFIRPENVDACPGCGDLCDVMTAMGGWACSRCEPQRAETTARWLSIRGRIVGRGA